MKIEDIKPGSTVFVIRDNYRDDVNAIECEVLHISDKSEVVVKSDDNRVSVLTSYQCYASFAEAAQVIRRSLRDRIVNCQKAVEDMNRADASLARKLAMVADADVLPVGGAV